MKVKLNLYIKDAEKFCRDPNSDCYVMVDGRHMDSVWLFAGEIEFDVDVDTQTVINAAQNDLDEQIAQHNTALNNLQNRKAELLALPAPAQPMSWSESDDQIDDESRDEQLAEEGRVFDSQRDRS